MSYKPLAELRRVELCNARGGIDENSLRAFTLSMKGTPRLLGAGRRALPTLGAYKTAQIWWSSNLSVHA